MKSATYYFHMKTKTLGDFQISIGVPLKETRNSSKIRPLDVKKRLAISKKCSAKHQWTHMQLFPLWYFAHLFTLNAEALFNFEGWLEKILHRKTLLMDFSSCLQLYLKTTPTQVFSCEFCKTFKNTYFERHLPTDAFF